jgi:hypothetical protein
VSDFVVAFRGRRRRSCGRRRSSRRGRGHFFSLLPTYVHVHTLKLLTHFSSSRTVSRWSKWCVPTYTRVCWWQLVHGGFSQLLLLWPLRRAGAEASVAAAAPPRLRLFFQNEKVPCSILYKNEVASRSKPLLFLRPQCYIVIMAGY